VWGEGKKGKLRKSPTARGQNGLAGGGPLVWVGRKLGAVKGKKRMMREAEFGVGTDLCCTPRVG